MTEAVELNDIKSSSYSVRGVSVPQARIGNKIFAPSRAGGA